MFTAPTVIADFAPPIVHFSIGGGVVVGWLFFTVAVVSGGLWLSRRYRKEPGGRYATVCLGALGGVALAAAVVYGVYALLFWAADVLLVSLLAAVVGVVLLSCALRLRL